MLWVLLIAATQAVLIATAGIASAQSSIMFSAPPDGRAYLDELLADVPIRPGSGSEAPPYQTIFAGLMSPATPEPGCYGKPAICGTMSGSFDRASATAFINANLPALLSFAGYSVEDMIDDGDIAANSAFIAATYPNAGMSLLSNSVSSGASPLMTGVGGRSIEAGLRVNSSFAGVRSDAVTPAGVSASLFDAAWLIANLGNAPGPEVFTITVMSRGNPDPAARGTYRIWLSSLASISAVED
jgi:hypothetical protein